MPTTYFCSDLHLGHRNIIKNLRSQFASIEEHDAYLLEQINDVVGKNDTLQILGDCFFTQQGLDYFKNHIHCENIIIIPGNHDSKFLKDAIEFGCKLHGARNYKGFWLTHIPMHPSGLFGKINVHGHTHTRNIDDECYINLSMENIHFKPISIDQLRDYRDGKYSRSDTITIHL